MKVYEVIYSYGSYDDYGECSLGIFTEKTDAEKVKNDFETGYNLIKQKYEKRYNEFNFLDLSYEEDDPLSIEYEYIYPKMKECLDFNKVFIVERSLNTINYSDHEFFKALKE